MSIRVKGFLGQEIDIPEDRWYFPEEGLWVRVDAEGWLAVGFTEPAVMMAGGVRQTESLVDPGSNVEAGQTVCLALTSKVKYLASPVSGRFRFNRQLFDLESPYETPLFWIFPQAWDEQPGLADAQGYARTLEDSEGSRNPGGHKGGSSPTCKAVYSSIGEQRIKK